MNKDTALQQCSADTMNPADSKELKCQFYFQLFIVQGLTSVNKQN